MVYSYQCHRQGCMQNFSKGGGGQIWGTDKRGKSEAYVRSYTLHLLGGANAPPRPPLKYSPDRGIWCTAINAIEVYGVQLSM